jgi:hypothetical protein
MSKSDEKIEAIIAKHPHLSKEEATKILTEKNARKNKKRAEKTNRANEKNAAYEARAPKKQETVWGKSSDSE